MTIKDGYVLFGAEVANEKSKSLNSLNMIFAMDYANGTGWSSMKNHLEGIKFDTFTGSSNINMNLSTGSFSSGASPNGYYEMSTYAGSIPMNGGFETNFTSGTDWSSGANGGQGVALVAWASGTGTQSLRLFFSGNGNGGSCSVEQVVNLGSPLAKYGTLNFNAGAVGADPTVTVLLGGSTLFNSTFGNWAQKEFDVGSYTGSRLLQFLIKDQNPIGSVFFDQVQFRTYGSNAGSPDYLISNISAGTTSSISSAMLVVNGSFPPNTLGSYFLSANSGTNWEAVTPGSYYQFSNAGSSLAVRIQLQSSGNYTPKIYEYGVQWSEEA